MTETSNIGFGGGCHWCTEGVFQSLIGIQKVEQGWISAKEYKQDFSEAVIVHFNPSKIGLKDLIEIHLLTHSSTSNHKRRDKYRSAVYVFSEKQAIEVKNIIHELQADFEGNIITKTLLFEAFKENIPEQLNYFYSNTEKPFCERHIKPKLKILLKKHAKFLNKEKVNSLNIDSI